MGLRFSRIFRCCGGDQSESEPVPSAPSSPESVSSVFESTKTIEEDDRKLSKRRLELERQLQIEKQKQEWHDARRRELEAFEGEVARFKVERTAELSDDEYRSELKTKGQDNQQWVMGAEKPRTESKTERKMTLFSSKRRNTKEDNTTWRKNSI